MITEITQIRIGDIAKGFIDDDEKGAKAFSNKLNLRPPYQREYCYGNNNGVKEDAVVETILQGYPLGFFYWAENEDGTYEIIDGQQRTISFCRYMNNIFSFSKTQKKFFNLSKEQQQKIEDYKIFVCICKGNTDDRLEWFIKINTSPSIMKTQELLNAHYTGTWLSDAKRYFSKTNCAAQKISEDYVKGDANRQDILEVALNWITDGNPASYMSDHQHDANAKPLYDYFETVIKWIKTTFPTTNKVMKSVNWGKLWKTYHENKYDIAKLEKQVNILMANESVTKKAGIYEFVLSGQNMDLANLLSVRAFSEKDKQTAYAKQKGIDPFDEQHYKYDDMEADHIIPWVDGGTSTLDNLQMISKKHNRQKGARITI